MTKEMMGWMDASCMDMACFSIVSFIISAATRCISAPCVALRCLLALCCIFSRSFFFLSCITAADVGERRPRFLRLLVSCRGYVTATKGKGMTIVGVKAWCLVGLYFSCCWGRAVWCHYGMMDGCVEMAGGSFAWISLAVDSVCMHFAYCLSARL